MTLLIKSFSLNLIVFGKITWGKVVELPYDKVVRDQCIEVTGVVTAW